MDLMKLLDKFKNYDPKKDNDISPLSNLLQLKVANRGNI